MILMVTFSISTVFSQEENNALKNTLELATGYTLGYLTNLAFAPVQRYEYNALNYQLKYTRITKKEKLFEVQLDYLNSELETNIIPEANPQYAKLVLNISTLKQVYKNEKFKAHVGLQTQTNIASYFDWRQYDVQQKLGVAGRFAYQINDNQSISSKVVIPVILWRTSTFEESFYSLNKYQSALWVTEYKYSISTHFDLKAGYTFNYDRLQVFNAYRELQHQINLGIHFKF
ncbi:hypothetical protein SAMN04488508_101642 [Aquimarina spongiae]|uniref:Outer membrane protein beta-barrel domain-containing protein n=1 Tax=Aquimarina spongiae TaxID=570521 RepID=A0A1M6B5U4_9FLAO|nr:hypothetical protein SAMN04488508_101642 [Aquimarina spongiae]